MTLSTTKQGKPHLTPQRKADFFKALAHPTRLAIVEKLGENLEIHGGEQCVCVLLEMFEIDFSTISRHLAVLKNAGVVTSEKRGKNVYYRLACPCLMDIFYCLDGILDHQDET
ncbi:MAG: metalloregulator ArsR/SmtB family transcription factor [Thermoguttaceae bacterium]|nr:metalloregulator ArsR/SmtB family transcription factor [Thermoguttaceae bacterium]